MDPVVVLVRHADSIPPTVGGPSELDRPLSPRGVSEAADLVPVLSTFDFATAASSPYRRALATIEPTTERLGLHLEQWPALREWDSGLTPTPEWEPAYRAAWRDIEQRYGEGESMADLTRRASRVMDHALDVASRSGPLLLASHGTWIARALLGFGVDVTISFWLTMPMPAVYVWRGDSSSISIEGPGIASGS